VSGDALTTIKTGWTTLLKAAKITGFRLHDCRHHFASRLVMKGVDLVTVSRLLGHSDVRMSVRYSHLAPDDLAAAVWAFVDVVTRRSGSQLSVPRLRSALLDCLDQQVAPAGHLVSLGELVWRQSLLDRPVVASKQRRRDVSLLRAAALTARAMPTKRHAQSAISRQRLPTNLRASRRRSRSTSGGRGGQECSALGLLINGAPTNFHHSRLPLRVTEGGFANRVFEVLAPLVSRGGLQPDWRTRRD
jgi:hypothetical protein